MTSFQKTAVRIGIGGPVGAGKTSLTAALVKQLKGRFSIAVITNDIYTQEDAEALMRMQILPSDRVIGVETGCPIAVDPQFSVDPTPADAVVMATIAEAAADLGLSHSHLPSRASHDAQEVGRRWPMGMIFVPSRGGLSHSAAEFTSDEQCWAGTAVLLETLLRLDRQLP